MNIEFRIWDEVNEKMIYSVDCEFQENGATFWYNRKNDDENVDYIMLYSTLKDDCKIKIYDKDIVKIHNERESMTPYLSVVTVDLVNGTTVMPHPNQQKLGNTSQKLLSEYVNDNKHTSCYVVGNECRNPELVDKIEEELQQSLVNDDNNISCFQQEKQKSIKEKEIKTKEVESRRKNNKPNVRSIHY